MPHHAGIQQPPDTGIRQHSAGDLAADRIIGSDALGRNEWEGKENVAMSQKNLAAPSSFQRATGREFLIAPSALAKYSGFFNEEERNGEPATSAAPPPPAPPSAAHPVATGPCHPAVAPADAAATFSVRVLHSRPKPTPGGKPWRAGGAFKPQVCMALCIRRHRQIDGALGD